jgi:cytochrome c oxidase subunit 2
MVWVGSEAWNAERLVDHIPEDAEVIKVTGQQWFWTFEHEDGTIEKGELHVKKGKAYKFEITSKDVNHSFNIHDYVVLMDAVAGRINTVWFEATDAGVFPIQCREYCGLIHYNMRGTLYVEDGST